MKNILIALGLMMVSLFSCQHSKSSDEKIIQSEVAVEPSTKTQQGVEVNSKGDKLEYVFNNTNNTATFILNGQTIEMIGDNTKASGANYKNDNYTYTNWHGITELKKNGETIFYNDSNAEESVIIDID